MKRVLRAVAWTTTALTTVVSLAHALTGADRVRVRFVPHDVWVGVHVSHWHVDVCPVPCLCFRIARRRRSGPPQAGDDRAARSRPLPDATHPPGAVSLSAIAGGAAARAIGS